MAENTEKPWAVYGWFLGPWGIGKVIRASHKSLNIKYSEGQLYPAELWDSEWVRSFDSPLKAMAYYLVKNNEGLTREEVVKGFLDRFPSQAKELEKCLQRPIRLIFRKSTLEAIDMPHL